MGPGDVAVARVLRERYDIAARSFEAVDGGIDPLALKRVARADSGEAWFLKLRAGVDRVRLRVARHLFDNGLEGVVAPLPTRGGRLSSRVDGFDLVVYPYVEGDLAIRAGLTEDQWVAYGQFMRALHEVRLPAALAGRLQRETFDGEAAARVTALDGLIESYRGTDPARLELAELWGDRRRKILDLVAVAEERRGAIVRRGTAEFVVCHSDIHVANVLVGRRGELHVVDWDDILLAPRERDLKFVVGARVGSFVIGEGESEPFLRGYGAANIDAALLRWYGEEWLVVDIAVFAHEVLLLEGTDPATRADAVAGLRTLLD